MQDASPQQIINASKLANAEEFILKINSDDKHTASDADSLSEDDERYSSLNNGYQYV